MHSFIRYVIVYLIGAVVASLAMRMLKYETSAGHYFLGFLFCHVYEAWERNATSPTGGKDV